jgi:16S rRNA processing protein RimM
MLLTVGQILRPHGVRGEVVVEVVTDEPQRRYAVGATLLAERSMTGRPPAARAGAPVPATLTVTAVRPHQGRLLITFEGIADRDAAVALRGVLLRIDSEAVDPPVDPEEFHDHQLVGLAAVDLAGQPLGTIAGVDHAPASDLLVLARPDGGRALVPFVRAIVTEVDVSAGRVVVDPPGGLLDL